MDVIDRDLRHVVEIRTFFSPPLRFICTSRYTKVQIFIFFDAADICNNLGVQYARVRNL